MPAQISMWRAEAIKNMPAVFGQEKVFVKKEEISVEKLLAKIGQLT